MRASLSKANDHFEAMAGICGDDYKPEELVQLRRIETSKIAACFDADRVFFTDGLPEFKATVDFATCKWAYKRVSTERPDVPKCQRAGFRLTQR
jgi:hypothetical protein